MLDFKKQQKELYQPGTSPALVDVPEMPFIMVDGRGDPNTSPDYAAAVEILYGLSYAIRMSPKRGSAPAGYHEYVVPPLEGLWSLDDGGAFTGGGPIPDKGMLVWTMMIRQPEFVTPEVVEAAKAVLVTRKPELDLSVARIERFAEGLCAQAMHLGPFDEEATTVAAIERFIVDSGRVGDISDARRHHEIYLSDPRRTAPERLRTVIRHPVRPVG